MVLDFAYSGAVPDGGPVTTGVGNWYTLAPPTALIDASQYSGIQFWLWVSPDTVAGLTSFFEVTLQDKWFTLGDVPDGGCDPYSSGPTACAFAAAAVANSAVAQSQATGALLGGDGGVLSTFSAGWQLVKAPWNNLWTIPAYGGAVESAVDPTALTTLRILVRQVLTPDAGAAPIPVDFCIYDLAFYR
jgi:hypothetical protein